MKHRTFIIGNGFDLDLGLDTSYHEFVNSEFWPIVDSDINKSSLANQLQKDSKDNWFDLEDSLCEYGKAGISKVVKIGTLQYDQIVYYKIKDALSKFIRNHEMIEPNKNSMAAEVMRRIASYGVFDNILSFNYTDLNIIGEKIVAKKVKYRHVHGSISGNDIILGTGSNFELKKDYDFLYKTSDTKYRSANVRYSLQDVDEVVFYGHSLGQQDYDYFKDFFDSCCEEGMTQDDSVNITFFTKDAESEIQLKRQLRTMISNAYGRLVDSNKVVFIHTQDKDSTDLVDFYNRMSEIQKEIIRQKSGRGIRIGRN